MKQRVPSCHWQSINPYQSLVHRLARQLIRKLPSHIALDDLIQAGMIGLLEALQHFQCDRGARFTTYATIRIRGAMLDEVRRQDWFPRSIHQKSHQVEQVIKQLSQCNGCLPRQSEVAAALNLSMDDYQHLLQDLHYHQLFSLDEFSQGYDLPTSGYQDPCWQAQMEDGFAWLNHLLTQLPMQQRQVMIAYYVQHLNLKQIGVMLGVTESRVSQIRSQAMLQLQRQI
ncbi:MAG: FliA/WhiG family RNA polymerase sigma factor [Legionellales bacterium]|nr:FliA/WhiG family RNA polymerase sigma factor [Legionellales bacterium]